MEQLYLKRCNCGNYAIEHYFNVKTNEMIYVHTNTVKLELVCNNHRCRYFYHNTNMNKCRRVCNFKHLTDWELPDKDNNMSPSLSKHSRVGNNYGWITNIDTNSEYADYINEIYNSKLYYNIVSLLQAYQCLDYSYLRDNLNLEKFFQDNIIAKNILTCLPGIYYYNNLYHCVPDPNIVINPKRKLEVFIEELDKLPISKSVKKEQEIITPPGARIFGCKEIKLNLDPIEKQIRNRKKVKFQPTLKDKSDWYEKRSKNIMINCTGVIYYVNKKTGETSWQHPVTKQTNLPGGYKTPEEAGMI